MAKLTLCIAAYYDPSKYILGEEPEIVRVTAVVFDTVSNENVERLEFGNEDDLGKATDRIVALASKYNIPLHYLSEPVSLEKCSCGCAGWLDRIITVADLARGRVVLN